LYNNEIEKILEQVNKPARYLGNELNSVHKDLNEVDVRFVFAFPDTYEIGMSHLGIKILYHLLNEQKDIQAERVFAPWTDMEALLREKDIPLFSLETREPLINFDFIGFTLQYEMSYTNILNMLDMANIPAFSKDRKKDYPFIIGGGPCAYNPEPIADFFDFFVIGEGEEVILELIEKYKIWKNKQGDKDEFLKTVANIKGIYVPELYKVYYNEDKTIKEVKPLTKNVPDNIEKRFISDLDSVYYPSKFIVPYMGVVHDRAMLEIFRGCTRGCRFCQAGMIYRPVREKSMETLKDQGEKLIADTGYEEISLVSLSSGDYSHLEPLTRNLLESFKRKGVNISLPSLRLDSFSLKMAELVQEVRKSGLTFAPEAGTQRLRDVINKGVTEKDLLECVEGAFELGWHNIKLYFMIGLPTVTYEDLDGIIDLARKIVKIYKDTQKPKENRLKLTISTSSFVPKAFTPFQWEPQLSIEELRNRQNYLRERLKSRQITYDWHKGELSFLEAVMSKGDRNLSQPIYNAWLKGCKFDSWAEHFNYGFWMEAFKECNIDPSFYAYRSRDYEEILPWEHINPGVSKKFLIREHRKGTLDAKLTSDCRIGPCTACGIRDLQGGEILCKSDQNSQKNLQ